MNEDYENRALDWILYHIFRQPHTKEEYTLLADYTKKHANLDEISA